MYKRCLTYCPTIERIKSSDRDLRLPHIFLFLRLTVKSPQQSGNLRANGAILCTITLGKRYKLSLQHSCHYNLMSRPKSSEINCRLVYGVVQLISNISAMP